MELPKGFFHLVKSWFRLEPRNRSEDHIPIGLQARTADSLWYLSRQWVTSEFQGEDAGSIIKAEVEYTTEPVQHFAPDLKTYGPLGDIPLEVVVERETVMWDWRMRIRAGQHAETIIRERHPEVAARLIADLRARYKIVVPNENDVEESVLRYIKLMEGRTADGKGFYDDPNSAPELTEVKKEFVDWYSELICQPATPNSCWQPASLDYRFSVKTTDGAELVSDHYRNGDLEWYSANLKAASSKIVPNVIGSSPPLTPERVRFAGMAHPRWWMMEDRVMDFSKMDVGKSELIKTMLMNFMLVHGDDWYVVPLPLPAGSLTEVRRVTTTDVFGLSIDIQNGRVNDVDPLKRWDLFSLSKHGTPSQNADRDYVYLPPSNGFREESESQEEVLFIRDENANRVFGIERRAPTKWGTISQAHELNEWRDRLLQQNEPPAKQGTSLTYRLVTEVPRHWVPYHPTRIAGSNSQIFLAQAHLPNFDPATTGISVAPIEPQTTILRESKILNEEAITRAGVLVKMNRQRMRWTDGKTYVWVGRSVVTGRGEGSSGLKFDVVENK